MNIQQEIMGIKIFMNQTKIISNLKFKCNFITHNDLVNYLTS